MFIGVNGAGKSNILEAIGVLSGALGKGVMPQELDYKGVRLSLPHLFKSTFKNRKIPKTFSISAEFNDFSYGASVFAGESSANLHFRTEHLDTDQGRILGRGPNGAKLHRAKDGLPSSAFYLDSSRSVYNALGTFAELDESVIDQIDEIASYVVYAPQTAVMRGIAPDVRAVEPLGIIGGRLAHAFEEVIRHIGDLREKKKHKLANDLDEIIKIIWSPGWADSMEIGLHNSKIVPDHIGSAGEMIYISDRFMKSGRNQLSAYDASEGTLYLIFIATLLAHPRSPKILALDNVDGTLNPGLVRRLVEHIANVTCNKERDDISSIKQIFMTSHNPTALDAIDIFNDDQRIFIVSRNSKDGGTEFLRLQPPKGMNKSDWQIRSGGKSLSRMWIEDQLTKALG
tara:strand:- start:46 stop:1242 length:1197 start_codon:yes stop_codon:yes gene_type:complete